MTKFLNPKAVREVLKRVKSGDDSEFNLKVVLAAAEAYSQMEIEWGMSDSTFPDLMHSTKNILMIETLHAGAPERPILARVAGAWEHEQ